MKLNQLNNLIELIERTGPSYIALFNEISFNEPVQSKFSINFKNIELVQTDQLLEDLSSNLKTYSPAE